ncbi:pyocin knob domain-containing protein [Limosilactobacillus reuteri]|uniref:pyocin knob domain-containing protein n=4 Tax=Limosilactobacillus reuteri TaxID=1598 RepID=UPI001E5A9388|nr:hypothetical protein [Limosilactobacillus reuteri]MCC4486351.1 hypothetical protein [Limosilactobacillus reuteri]
MRNVQGDVSTLKQTATGIKSTLASHEGDIHTLQSDSKSLKDSMADAQGDISTLKKTSTDVTSELKDHAGRISKAEQTASTLVNEFADQQGYLNRVEQTAQGTQQTVANQQGQINNIKTDAAGMHQMITGQGNQIANINVTLSGLNSKYDGVSGDLGKLKNSAMQNRGTVSAPDFNSLTAAGFYTITVPSGGKNYPTGSWGTLEVSGQTSDSNGRLNQKYVSDNNAETYVRQYNANTKSWTAWIKAANQNDVTELSNRITTNSTQITQNQQAIALKADQSTVNNLSGEVSQAQAQLKVQAGQISSKVSSTDFKTLDDKVNGMKIGGRNLVLGTDNDIVIDDTGNTGIQGWHFATINLTQQPKVGDQITVSAEATLTGQGDLSTYDVILYNQAVGSARSNSKRLSSGKRASATLQVNNLDGNGDTVLLIYAGNISDTEGKKNTVHHLKVEFGNLATDWTPAPEDLTTAIQKNSTAIDQTNQQISLKADQTEVNEIKGTASQNSSRLDVMAGQISSKVTSTDVNNIVDSKGYATTSTVQSLITQKAGTINESITNLTNEMNTRNGVNLLKGTKDFSGSWRIWDNGNHWHTENWLDLNGNPSLKSDTMVWAGYYQPIWLEKGEYTFSCYYNPGNGADLQVYIIPNGGENLVQATGDGTKLDSTPNQWHLCVLHFKVTKAGNAAVRIESSKNAVFHIASYKLEKGTVTKPVWTPAPSDNATVTQFQQITASIDGLQSTVVNKADKSQITQLSNVIQSKVSSSDFNDLKDKTTWKSTDSIDLNTAVSQQKIFVKGGSNLPPGSYWWYVRVEPGYASRIAQYAVSDRDNIHYSRQYDGSKWSAWSQGATESEITQLRDDINLRVKSGDLLSQINLTAHNTLIQSNKIYLDSSSTVFSGRAFIPSAAIASLSADKVNTGWLNTNNVNLGDGRTRIIADHDYMYIQPTGSAASNTGIRMGYSGLDFLTNVIPNGYSSSVPYYSVGYDGAANGYFKISAFDHINPGGTTATQNWFTMYDAISLNNKEVNIAANNKPRIRVTDNGIEVRPTIFFNNENYSGTWAGFTRLDNKDVVEFNTGNNDGENFHVNSGARFMKYVYFNDYCRAQGWLTYSTLSKKTNIKKLDTSLALDKIRQDDQYLYEYKRNVAKGVYDPQASFIIDDVNDVSHYSVPREFIDQTGKYREPSVELSYLIAAFQEIDKQVQLQKEEIKELKEKLQHE